MATYTSYLNLEKPNTSETFNLLKMNANWDRIDNGVSALNSNLAAVNNITNLTITAAPNVSINARSYACMRNGFLFIYAKGEATANVTNDNLFTISGVKNVLNPITVSIGLGTEWNITSIGYGFINGKTLIGTVAQDEWFHVTLCVPWA